MKLEQVTDCVFKHYRAPALLFFLIFYHSLVVKTIKERFDPSATGLRYKINITKEKLRLRGHVIHLFSILARRIRHRSLGSTPIN